MRHLDARERYRCIAERFEAQHGNAAAFDCAMILLNHRFSNSGTYRITHLKIVL
jgi:hypothetical protein